MGWWVMFPNAGDLYPNLQVPRRRSGWVPRRGNRFEMEQCAALNLERVGKWRRQTLVGSQWIRKPPVLGVMHVGLSRATQQYPSHGRVGGDVGCDFTIPGCIADDAVATPSSGQQTD